MNTVKPTKVLSSQQTTPAERSSPTWREQHAKLAAQTIKARRGLVERVARQRDFSFLDEMVGIKPEQYSQLLETVTESYLNGTFFLKHLGLFFDVAPELCLLVFQLRQEWIRQYDLKTVPELMLLDEGMLAHFHVLRLHKEVANMLALTESHLYMADPPAIKIKKENRLNNEFDGFVAEDAIKKLQERLMPLIEAFNKMFLRSLRALREMKVHPIQVNIGQAGSVNVGQQQVNVAPST